MNKKNINFYFDTKTNNKTKMELIEKYGFDGIFLMCDSEFDENVALAKKYNLFIESAHLPYKNVCNSIWLDDASGDEYKEMVIDWIKRLSKAEIKVAVIHAAATITPPAMSEVGFKRFKEIIKVCEEYNVILAVENVHDWSYVYETLDRLNSDYARICFDFGHANAFTNDINNIDYKLLASKIVCLHIHDNFGEKDEHLIPFDGNIDFPFVLKKLKDNGYNGCITLELECQKLYNDINKYLTKAKCILDKLGDIYENEC